MRVAQSYRLLPHARVVDEARVPLTEQFGGFSDKTVIRRSDASPNGNLRVQMFRDRDYEPHAIGDAPRVRVGNEARDAQQAALARLALHDRLPQFMRCVPDDAPRSAIGAWPIAFPRFRGCIVPA
jgi:hypothetical protein